MQEVKEKTEKLAHIHAQAQGIGMDHSGLYNNAALERQADREGMLAAYGRPVRFCPATVFILPPP